jgi:3-phenylpropionate/trans-cinnamate dioxygenase ferredoxin subunit
MADFLRVCPASEIPAGNRRVFEIEGRFVVIFHVEGKFFALDDCCTHDGGPLGEGELEGVTVVCPRHGAKFDIRDGRALSMPAVVATPAHEVKVDGGDLWVRLSAENA